MVGLKRAQEIQEVIDAVHTAAAALSQYQENNDTRLSPQEVQEEIKAWVETTTGRTANNSED